MNIFINPPTWLGDAVMASPFIKGLYDTHKGASFVIYGSFACEIFANYPNTTVIYEDKKSRLKSILRVKKSHPRFDLALSFRGAFSAKIMLFLLNAKQSFAFDKRAFNTLHQVKQYHNFALNFLAKPIKDQLFLPILKQDKKDILALCPGASYGDAKCWEWEYFAKVALHFKHFHILLLGGQNEASICEKIQNVLLKNKANVTNLAGKTSLITLAKHISSAKLLLTNDSGPMHIGAVYKTPTLAIFGPTSFDKTSPWQNENARLLHLDLPCMPCFKRVCPRGDKACMKNLTPKIVINAARDLGF